MGGGGGGPGMDSGKVEIFLSATRVVSKYFSDPN